MEIVLASRNNKKIKELQQLMAEVDIPDIKILSLNDVGIFDDIEENGLTFEENARIKASAGAAKGYITVADDSGLCVDALNGAPGVHSARFSGQGDDENNKLLQKKLEGLSKSERGASFVSAVVCIFPETNEEIVTFGEAKGYITEQPMGTNGFGYDPYFYYPPLDKTFAQMTAEEKNAISHRGIAMKKFAEKLVTYAKTHGLI